ncbi:magnesium transporter CorA family protein [Actinoplanes sp. NPDC089786]|uniref:magnesium transporter CorA family protein n=1 Tax=Actinoplanes sp. NPDC089786 TaxID=3155185 RepID=UPI0034187995
MTTTTSGPPATTRLYQAGKVVEEGFPPERIPDLLREHPGAVLWLDLLDPEAPDLAEAQKIFGLHPLAVEDAVQDHERPKLDRYPEHLFLNLYQVRVQTAPPSLRKTEISAFILENALITVHKQPGDLAALTARWDLDAETLGADSGVAFLVYGLLDVVMDAQLDGAQKLDRAMDGVEDTLLEEGGAPRAVRAKGFELRRTLAMLQRGVAPMPGIVAELLDIGAHLRLSDQLKPYLRDVQDHAQHAAETTEMARERINGLLDADLNEQSNALNDITKKLAAWAAIIAVPTAVTGYFGQNVPYPSSGTWVGVVASAVLMLGAAGSLIYTFKKKNWL